MSAPSVSSSSSTQPSSIAAKLEQAKRNREQQKIDSAQLKQQKQEEKQIVSDITLSNRHKAPGEQLQKQKS